MLIIDELDAIARSRNDGGNMHSDEKANVNELLVQIDRVLALRRVMVATTNFMSSLDDAVLRSGRFGRFIPVPPPDLEEAVEIVMYYVGKLEPAADAPNGFQVKCPGTEEVRLILSDLLAENSRRGHFFCGADLEDGVNRAYMVAAQAAESVNAPTVSIDADLLQRSLQEVPRSVRRTAIRRFVRDARKYCSDDVYSRLNERLRKAQVMGGP
jgi:SpoVK/Ycf46/Vps4 family AAA+-type ATPase